MKPRTPNIYIGQTYKEAAILTDDGLFACTKDHFNYLAFRKIMLTFATATTELKSYTDMRQVLFMAVLAAGMLLTACSKEDSNGIETKDNTEQQALIKEQIVGVWRNGEYWVSFDGNGRKPVEGEPLEFGPSNFPAYYDGQIRAVLQKGDSCYNNGGRYIIKGNKINVYNGSKGGNPEYVVTDISNTSVTFIITIPASFDDEEDCTYTMSFIKERNVSGSD